MSPPTSRTPIFDHRNDHWDDIKVDKRMNRLIPCQTRYLEQVGDDFAAEMRRCKDGGEGGVEGERQIYSLLNTHLVRN